MNKSYFLAVLFFAFLAIPFAAHAHCAGKHFGKHPHCTDEEPPPPPPPPNANCTGVPDFPGFAYSLEVFGGKRGRDPGFELYLSSTDRSCSAMIYSTPEDMSINMSYRQNGTQGRMVWVAGEEVGLKRNSSDKGKSVVYLATFTVTDGVVSDFALSIAYRHPTEEPQWLPDAELSPDGNTAYFIFNDAAGFTINAIDLTSCTSECDSEIIAVATNEFYDLAMNTSGSRLYFTQLQDGLGFIDTVTSTIRYVLHPSDYPTTVSFLNLSVGQLASGNEALAVLYDNVNTIDIIDVGTCMANGSSASCFSTGESAIHRSGILGGRRTSFFGLDLLVQAPQTAEDGSNINLLDVDTLNSYIFVRGGKSADSAE